MANLVVNTNYDPLIYHVQVQTFTCEPIRIIAYDAKQTTTVFTDRKKNVNGVYDFYIRMPQCGLVTNILVFNDAVGVLKDGVDSSFKILAANKLPLDKGIVPMIDLTISQKSFLRFSQKIAYNASVMNKGTYTSDDGRFTFVMYDEILDNNGQVIPTSFRISTYDGTIEASKKMVGNYTLPVIFLLMWHEYSHCYINKDIDNELEADLNALNIYLGLGYPYIDAIWALAITFEGNKTDENAIRWEFANKYIDDFYGEKSKYKN